MKLQPVKTYLGDPLELPYAGAWRSPVEGEVDEALRSVLLVGELNPLSDDGRFALVNFPTGCSGERLQRLITGVPEDGYHAMWRTNLCQGRWSLKTARDRAAVLADPWSPWETIVLLGRKVADAFGYSGAYYTSEQRTVLVDYLHDSVRRKVLVSLPHPSGLCREWYKPGAYDRARAVLSGCCPEVPWGSL